SSSASRQWPAKEPPSFWKNKTGMRLPLAERCRTPINSLVCILPRRSKPLASREPSSWLNRPKGWLRLGISSFSEGRESLEASADRESGSQGSSFSASTRGLDSWPAARILAFPSKASLRGSEGNFAQSWFARRLRWHRHCEAAPHAAFAICRQLSQC